MRRIILLLSFLSILVLSGCTNSDSSFKAKIDNEIVFDSNEIASICSDAACSGIHPSKGCIEEEENYTCYFLFSITLTQSASDKMAEATQNLQLTEDEEYLNSPLDLYLDGKKFDSLRIASEVKGKPIKEILISGDGKGKDRSSAHQNAIDNMKELMLAINS